MERYREAEAIVSTRTRGLGPKLSTLSDDLMLTVLGCLDGKDLARFSGASRAAYVMANHADLWRSLVLGTMEDRMKFDEVKGSWRHTWLQSARPAGWEACPRHVPIQVRGIYSDALYKPWACANLSAPEHWLRTCSIPRVAAEDLSVERFEREFEVPNRPVIITGLASKWPAMNCWSPADLERRFGDRTFVAGGFRLTMGEYIRYAAVAQDDQPLYLFDRRSMTTAPELLEEYTVPPYFAEERDCFTALGEHRPARRWLIVGPDRSGSTFHKDPNSTCAWNAVAHGRKRWIMYPPDTAPPGVHATDDGMEVAAPIALTEWLLDFYAAAAAERAKSVRAATRAAAAAAAAAAASPKATAPASSAAAQPDAKRHCGEEEAAPASVTAAAYPLEATCEKGEIMFVPRGWWHTAVNIGAAVAVTQNYVPPCGAWHAWRFMLDKTDQVTGVPCEEAKLMGARFAAAMKEKMPKVWRAVEAKQAEAEATFEANTRVRVAKRWLDAVRPGAAAHGTPRVDTVSTGGAAGSSALPGASPFGFGFGAPAAAAPAPAGASPFG
ncbi:hypothetical protein FNF27_06494 [Cafeteria roenbergensis]|uniref:JmjC domain-containing protein n=2 Tax=Cafeteria roenbergensis TaxID=33653 RepID=A0A5A8DZB2_CAFRO|nr:hypothetical protein FNF29_06493 [Cafeteria roenbergensis]KAA0162467.1 hypothetical protein FNF31_03266 [Cafeteria roenbergensis]KAA0170488.1 hypothetical protein FNF28_01482 [Cafeteria roenbergensis]KAA0170797.1 hypothetical protein FNF27_06494 [Cafeteria roenbergensis]|eukprot:KAA0148711.1 hypothetical protein FNF29_06493 [Cafeteria roenbergensis]